MSLVRLKPGELLLDEPLAFPIFGRTGRLLLAAGCWFPVDMAEDMLAIGLYRKASESSSVEEEYCMIHELKKPTHEIIGLSAPVETVQIEFMEHGNPAKTILPVKFIGAIPDNSLIVSVPQRDGRTLHLPVGMTIGVKVCTGRRIHAFSSMITCCYKTPIPYMHLSYPTLFNTQVFRSSYRGKVNILAILEYGSEYKTPVSIIELSSKGAAFICEYEIGNTGDQVHLQFSLTSHDSRYPMRVSATIRKFRQIRSRQNYLYGIEMTDIETEQSLIIQSFIYENF